MVGLSRALRKEATGTTIILIAVELAAPRCCTNTREKTSYCKELILDARWEGTLQQSEWPKFMQ